MTEAVIYARLSPRPKDRNGREAESITTQLTRCRAYAMTFDMEVIAEFTEPDTSARLHEQPELEKALKLVYQKKCALIIYSLTRLSRKGPVHAFGILEQMQRKKATLVVFDMRVDTSTPQGKLLFGILACVAQWQAEDNAVKIGDALRRLQSSGRLMSRYAPYGYEIDYDGPVSMNGKPAWVKENPKEQVHIRYILRSAKNGVSSAKISRALNEKGIKCRNLAWRRQKVDRLLRQQGYERPERRVSPTLVEEPRVQVVRSHH